jgi:uncharacterized protein YbbC (DUF1343 family)/CubicO group peptidase (beta-lactamase class C family)
MRLAAVLATCLVVSSPAEGQSLAPAGDTLRGFDRVRLARLDPLIEKAINDRLLPGAVVVVGQGDQAPLVKAFGKRALVPTVEPMTPDTIFDVASLTKVVATTTGVMQLVEGGRLRLSDRVSAYIPEFGRYGKQDVTIRHLLTHVSGLRPDLDLNLEFNGYDEAIRRASEEVLEAAPGERFIYSDINFFLLGEIVTRVSGERLDGYVRRHIFEPLGMKDTMFRPAEAMRPRIAPTERCALLAWPCDKPDAPMLRGVVHDPTARRMGGVAGHAGLFSTATDLARFCRMLLRGGELDGARVLAPLTVAKMTQPASPPGHSNQRGLGWDIDSSLSANRGELLPLGSFGHTGFTGTSIWIDPVTQIYIVFLSNRVHPDGKGDVTPLRARVATVVAAAFTGLVDLPSKGGSHVLPPVDLPPKGGSYVPVASGFSRKEGKVLTGVDVLRSENFAQLRGKRIALLTHLAARAQDGTSTVDVFRSGPGVQLVSIFSPEHGLAATLDTKVTSARDDKSGLTIHSLYGDTQRPTAAMLDGVDIIVVDLVDVGARFYTYPTTVAYVMEEAAKKKVPVMILDRPNPIGGVRIEGPNLDADLTHFAGYFPMPTRHGLTLGELARLFNGENGIGADVAVIEATGWRRELWFDETALLWTNPSPNMRNLNQATLYPGVGAIEWSNISVGRGTDTPFEQIGAPWVNGAKLAEALNARGLPGIRFYPVRFTPASSVYANEECAGVFMVITDREALRPVRTGVEIAAALHKLHPDRFDFRNTARLLGSQAAIDRIRRGDDPADVAASWADDEARWRLRRAKYLLYH